MTRCQFSRRYQYEKPENDRLALYRSTDVVGVDPRDFKTEQVHILCLSDSATVTDMVHLLGVLQIQRRHAHTHVYYDAGLVRRLVPQFARGSSIVLWQGGA